MTDVVHAINDAYAKRGRTEKPRRYIGASSVGNPCTAYLEYSLRGFPDVTPDPSLQRIFEDGHRIEARVVADLKLAKFHVMEIDSLTGKQWTYNLYGGHFSGHGDGIIEIDDEAHVLEIKSMNDAKHKLFASKGVKISHPMYYAQLQAMMGLSGMKKALFIAYNKNNSQYHAEVVSFDDFYYSALIVKVEHVLNDGGEKLSHDMTDWRCKSCFKRGACWGLAGTEPACSRCAHSVPTHDGEWSCKKHGHAVRASDECSDWIRFEPRPKA